MRPPELRVRFAMHTLRCVTPEDGGGDEPYLWVFGFKVDADTLGPPPTGSLIPTLGVQVFDGPPLFVAGTVGADDEISVPAAHGVREFALKPGRVIAQWFPGLAGVVCLLWDADASKQSTRNTAFTVFKDQFGPTLSAELTKLVNGGYDDPLSRDASGAVAPGTPDDKTLTWRFDRMGNPEVRKRVAKQMKDAIVPAIKDRIRDAVSPGIGEIVDQDDLLGAEVEVFMGGELGSLRELTLTFTDDEANYVLKGQASGQRVRIPKLDATVTGIEREYDQAARLWLKVCLHEAQEYAAFAFRQKVTTRFELRDAGPQAPSQVRWFLDGTLLQGETGSVQVAFDPVADYVGPPEDVLAPSYPGGTGTLHYRAEGLTLEVWNDPADGVHFGEVRALFAYPGDPPLGNTLESGYDRAAEFAVAAVDLAMDGLYRQHLADCLKRLADAEKRLMEPVLKIPPFDPGDPAPYRERILDRVVLGAQLARMLDVRILSHRLEGRVARAMSVSVPGG